LIQDSRQVKRPVAPLQIFYGEKTAAGVFKHIKASEALKLAADEYKQLPSSEQKV
jgi:hypothetical protein